MHPHYWNLLLKSQKGTGIDDRNENLVVVTQQGLSHGAFQPFVERSTKAEISGSGLAKSFNDVWAFLDCELQQQ